MSSLRVIYGHSKDLHSQSQTLLSRSLVRALTIREQMFEILNHLTLQKIPAEQEKSFVLMQETCSQLFGGMSFIPYPEKYTLVYKAAGAF